jgi:RPA family protein
MSGREPAWRVLSVELAACLEEERGEGERAANFVLSPLGARMNRVLLAGELGPAEPVGRDPAQPFWRARLVDPTGSVTVTAGGFQPRAMTALQGFQHPSPALVVGKVSLFHARDGTTSVSVRAEELRPAGPDEVEEVQTEAARQTLDRIDLLARLRRAPGAGKGEPRTAAHPSGWLDGARRARERYPSTDPESFRRGLAPLAGIPAPAPAPPRSAAPPPEVHRRELRTPPRARPPGDHAKESLFLDLVDELAEGADDGYADLREITRRAAERGLSESQVEEVLNRLEEDGILEEPIVGKLRRA